MTSALEDAIFDLVTRVQADGSILKVAEAAERLATEYGGDGQEVAALIINVGLTRGINMEMRIPGATGRPDEHGSALDKTVEPSKPWPNIRHGRKAGMRGLR